MDITNFDDTLFLDYIHIDSIFITNDNQFASYNFPGNGNKDDQSDFPTSS